MFESMSLRPVLREIIGGTGDERWPSGERITPTGTVGARESRSRVG